MNSTPLIRRFPDGAALAEALADHVAGALVRRIAQDERGALAVSGGRTPQRFFAALAMREIDWSAVDVTLVDERWIGEDSPRSNARLVREHLLRGHAAAARFVPLYDAAESPELARKQIESRIAALPLPFAAVVLGMGEDGHTASLFPDGDRLAVALDPSGVNCIETLRAPAAGEPRISLTLPVITQADALVLHIEGDAKRRVLENALAAAEPTLPIATVLAHSVHPATVFWCP